ncbi:hypothetical protein KR018_002120, partial [Drosophila ironensis]
MLILTVAVCWPAGTSAAPRRARGLHLIWPHKRSTPPPPPTTQVTKKSPHLPHQPHQPHLCAVKMSDETVNISRVNVALQVARDTRDAIVCLTNDWLDYSENKMMVSYINETRLHQLNLVHPLQDKVSQVTYVNESDGRFEYRGEVGEVGEELPRILATLSALDGLMNVLHANATREVKHFTHKPIHEKIHHNMAKAMEVANLHKCDAVQDLSYNQMHPALRFAGYMETIKVLTVMEHVYEQILER